MHPLAIEKIRIEKLFGKYTYDLPAEDSEIEDITRVLILYGDNGSGKTTILNLIYHLLSPGFAKGHKSIVANTIFKRVVIYFSDNTVITAFRSGEELIGPYNMTISRNDQIVDELTFRAQFLKEEKEYFISQEIDREGTSRFLEHLDQIGISYFLLSDDREFESDVFGDKQLPSRSLSDLITSGEWSSLTSGERDYALRLGYPPHVLSIKKMRDENLLSTKKMLEKFIDDQISDARSKGEMDTNTIYAEIAKSISFSADQPLISDKEREQMIQTFRDLSKRNQEYSLYGITTPLQIDEFIKTLETEPRRTINILLRVLEPYISGISAKLNALTKIYVFLNLFINTLDSFFIDKGIEFEYRKGLRIKAGDANINPASLSSGEKQLLILFSNTILAREKPSIFFIDEPELSLNVKWQRELISILLALTEGSSVQFILATHSIELLTQHKRQVVQLKRIED